MSNNYRYLVDIEFAPVKPGAPEQPRQHVSPVPSLHKGLQELFSVPSQQYHHKSAEANNYTDFVKSAQILDLGSGKQILATGNDTVTPDRPDMVYMTLPAGVPVSVFKAEIASGVSQRPSDRATMIEFFEMQKGSNLLIPTSANSAIFRSGLQQARNAPELVPAFSETSPLSVRFNWQHQRQKGMEFSYFQPIEELQMGVMLVHEKSVQHRQSLEQPALPAIKLTDVTVLTKNDKVPLLKLTPAATQQANDAYSLVYDKRWPQLKGLYERIIAAHAQRITIQTDPKQQESLNKRGFKRYFGIPRTGKGRGMH